MAKKEDCKDCKNKKVGGPSVAKLVWTTLKNSPNKKPRPSIQLVPAPVEPEVVEPEVVEAEVVEAEVVEPLQHDDYFTIE